MTVRRFVFSESSTKNFLSSLFKVILGWEFRKMFKYDKLKLFGLYRDHPQAETISSPTSAKCYKQGWARDSTAKKSRDCPNDFCPSSKSSRDFCPMGRLWDSQYSCPNLSQSLGFAEICVPGLSQRYLSQSRAQSHGILVPLSIPGYKHYFQIQIFGSKFILRFEMFIQCCGRPFVGKLLEITKNLKLRPIRSLEILSPKKK